MKKNWGYLTKVPSYDVIRGLYQGSLFGFLALAPEGVRFGQSWWWVTMKVCLGDIEKCRKKYLFSTCNSAWTHVKRCENPVLANIEYLERSHWTKRWSVWPGDHDWLVSFLVKVRVTNIWHVKHVVTRICSRRLLTRIEGLLANILVNKHSF